MRCEKAIPRAFGRLLDLLSTDERPESVAERETTQGVAIGLHALEIGAPRPDRFFGARVVLR